MFCLISPHLYCLSLKWPNQGFFFELQVSEHLLCLVHAFVELVEDRHKQIPLNENRRETLRLEVAIY